MQRSDFRSGVILNFGRYIVPHINRYVGERRQSGHHSHNDQSRDQAVLDCGRSLFISRNKAQQSQHRLVPGSVVPIKGKLAYDVWS